MQVSESVNQSTIVHFGIHIATGSGREPYLDIQGCSSRCGRVLHVFGATRFVDLQFQGFQHVKDAKVLRMRVFFE